MDVGLCDGMLASEQQTLHGDQAALSLFYLSKSCQLLSLPRIGATAPVVSA